MQENPRSFKVHHSKVLGAFYNLFEGTFRSKKETTDRLGSDAETNRRAKAEKEGARERNRNHSLTAPLCSPSGPDACSNPTSPAPPTQLPAPCGAASLCWPGLSHHCGRVGVWGDHSAPPSRGCSSEMARQGKQARPRVAGTYRDPGGAASQPSLEPCGGPAPSTESRWQYSCSPAHTHKLSQALLWKDRQGRTDFHWPVSLTTSLPPYTAEGTPGSWLFHCMPTSQTRGPLHMASSPRQSQWEITAPWGRGGGRSHSAPLARWMASKPRPSSTASQWGCGQEGLAPGGTQSPNPDGADLNFLEKNLSTNFVFLPFLPFGGVG